MIHSMTAFARHHGEGDWGAATWELRAVNQRYLDVALRLPEALRGIEGEVRERVKASLQRGKVECSLQFQAGEAHPPDIAVNLKFVERLAAASRQVDTVLYNPAPTSSLEVLRWPGVLQLVEADTSVVEVEVLRLLDQALEDVTVARRREGEKLKGFLEQRLQAMAAEVMAIREALPAVLARGRDRLRARLDELRAELEDARIEQELVLLAQKVDVSEELDRLEAHMHEVQRNLGLDGAVGRRLDFLMQELNREANTLGAKVQDSGISQRAVELKVLIEQMREQVQNIE